MCRGSPIARLHCSACRRPPSLRKIMLISITRHCGGRGRVDLRFMFPRTLRFNRLPPLTVRARRSNALPSRLESFASPRRKHLRANLGASALPSSSQRGQSGYFVTAVQHSTMIHLARAGNRSQLIATEMTRATSLITFCRRDSIIGELLESRDCRVLKT